MLVKTIASVFCRTPLWHHLMICSSFRQIPSLVIIIKSSGTNQSNHINAINYITEAYREGGREREQDQRMDRYKEEKIHKPIADSLCPVIPVHCLIWWITA